MRIRIPKTHAATECDIVKLELALGNRLPSAYIQFLSAHDGAKPELNMFSVSKEFNAGVEEFIPACDQLRIKDSVDGFPNAALPIASASGGNFVYLEPESGAIYFWDHEVESPDFKVANHFDEFLEKLTPLDLSKIKLKPGQVKRIWGNPDFTPEF